MLGIRSDLSEPVNNRIRANILRLLVVKDRIPDFAWKLCTLPFALKATSFSSRSRGAKRLHKSCYRAGVRQGALDDIHQ